MSIKKIVVSFCCIVCILLLTSFQRNGNNPIINNFSRLSLSFDKAATTPLLDPPYVSGVIEDPTDPASKFGIVVDVKDNDKDIKADDYTLTANSDNTLIVHNDKIVITKSDGHANVKITPSGFGYSNITLTLSKGSDNVILVINYAASNLSDFPENTFWHTGSSDASAAIALDNDYMVVADDELNALNVYPRNQSGLPVATFNYGDIVGLTEGDPGNYKEIDCEAGVHSLTHPERYYWTGSMCNGGKHFEEKPNRSCLFATDITGTGTTTKFSYVGSYHLLRKQLIKWGNNNGYKFSSATAIGETPKRIDGFNVEGVAFAPDSTTLYVGFRAPIVPITNRTKALIAPIENFETWFNNGRPSADPVIGKPIELNLGGRGIRDMVRLSNGSYVIVAGNSDEILNGALYTWTGRPFDEPVLVNMMDVYALKAEAYLEVFENGKATDKVQIISDNGNSAFYNDRVASKFLQRNYKKFRSDIVNLHQATTN